MHKKAGKGTVPLVSVKESNRLVSGNVGIHFSNNEVMLNFLTVALKEIHSKKLHGSNIPDGGAFQGLSLFENFGVAPLLTHVIRLYPVFQKVDGNMENMMNRLASFKDWPASAPISALRLVDSGFYFNVQNSKVACYSCALHIETRELACELKDDSVLNMHLRLSEKCPHALQQRHDKLLSQTGCFMFSFSKENTAIGGSVFGSVACDTVHKDNPNSLIRNIDNGDKTQTSISEESRLDVKQDFPIETQITDSLTFVSESSLHPNSLLGDQNVSVSNPECYATSTSRMEDHAYSIRYSEYKTVEKRLKTFESWPLNDKQNKEDLVLCGFFYTGQQDIVRCFSCDIGLAEWDETDEPWSEHARHSPHCKYLKKFKGQDFIDRVQREWRNIHNPESPQMQDLAKRIESFQCQWPECSAQSPKQIKEDVFYYTGLYKNDASDFLNILEGLQDTGEINLYNDTVTGQLTSNEISRAQDNSNKETDESKIDADKDSEGLEEENQRLKRQLLCLKCEKAERVMLFIPCGHRLVCETCSEKMRTCIQCQKEIQKKVKTYLC